MRVVAPKVVSVSGSESARSVCTYGVLVILQYLHDCARLVPLRWVVASLILDHDSVTTTKGGQALRVLVPSGTASDSLLG